MVEAVLLTLRASTGHGRRSERYRPVGQLGAYLVCSTPDCLLPVAHELVDNLLRHGGVGDGDDSYVFENMRGIPRQGTLSIFHGDLEDNAHREACGDLV